MSREVMQQALDALEKMVVDAHKWQDYGELAIDALREELAKSEPEPVSHAVIAGALFDFMGWLTSRKERLVLSSTDEASPAVDAIRDFAKMRGVSLDDAKVQDWYTAQRQPNDDYTSEADTEELVRVSNLPEPLHLAAMLEKTMQWPLHGKAADCLRRMYAEQRIKENT